MLLQVKPFCPKLPSAFINEPEDLDQDDIPTVKMLLELPGEEPPPELLARAEPISPAPAQEPAPTHAFAPTHAPAPAPPHEPDERITFTFVRDPIPAPDLKASLIEVHRRAGFTPRLTLPPIGLVWRGLLLAMLLPQRCTYSAMPSPHHLQSWWIVEQHLT